VVVPENSRPRILLCNSVAARLGVSPGQSANAALALAPELEIATRDVAAEERAMRQLATWANRFTPAVHIDASNALLLEVRASLKFFGGLGKLRATLVNALDAMGHRFVSACAPTALASLWLARGGRDLMVRECAELPGRLGGLSIDCLRWPADVRRMLTGIGVTTVGECIRLPRDGLARRIGPDRLDELDRGFGAQPDPRAFHRPPRHFEAMLDLPAETTDSDLLLVVQQKLLMRLEAFLCRHQGAVQTLWISLHHQDRPATLERVGLLRASADSSYLLELARIRYADLQLDAPVVAVTLRTALAPRPPAACRDLLGDQAGQHENAFALVEQLRVRLGAEAVHGIESVPEHRPEAAWKPLGFSAAASVRKESWHPPVAATVAGCGYAPVHRRPVWMLEEPRALNASAGRPVFEDVLHLEGDPERIETGWWDGRDIRRDYYVARNRRGMRLWIFRDYGRGHSDGNGSDSRWYLHGIFG